VRILTTLLVADAGSARVAGYDVVRDAVSVRSVIGLSGQFAAIDDRLLSHGLLRTKPRRRQPGGRRIFDLLAVS
jgi:ABC-2 type transport system ATP-binding protein